jgi:LAO/AO transport system kinase
VKCVSTRGEGVADLVLALDRHKEWLDGTEAGRARRHLRLAEELRESLRETLIEAATSALGSEIERAVSDVEAKTIDPYSATEQLLAAFKAR